MTKILMFGDVMGRPGRTAVLGVVERLQEEIQPDFTLANIENLAGGRGVSQKTYAQMCKAGFDGFTSGNHIWDNKDVYEIFKSPHCKLVRPGNYPSRGERGCPGSATTVLEKNGKSLRLINLMGRLFMDDLDCPFTCVDAILENETVGCPTLVDFHAETTSEKGAMGWYLDGRVSAVVGTHTHVQTADERVLPGGTAFISDIGMSGSFDSVIGMEAGPVIEKFISRRKSSFKLAEGGLGVGFVVITLGEDHKAVSIERRRFRVE